MLHNYKHIVWDWNGTLLDDAWLCVEVLNQMLSQRGRAAITLEFYRQHFKFPVIDFYNQLDFEANSESFASISREFIDHYQSRWLSECRLHPNTQQTLNSIQELGIQQSVLSAAEQTTLLEGLNHYKIEAYFHSIVGTNNIEATGKKEKGMELMRQLACQPEQILLIGDTLHDHEVAEAIGCDCALIMHGHNNVAQLQTANTRLVHDMHAVFTLLTD
ncbi:MAG: HAD family hydrolase [Opitutales bacterium]